MSERDEIRDGGHVGDELPRLLTGEAGRSEAAAVVVHLRGCERCRGVLIDLLAAHAPLASTARFAPEVVSSDATDPPLPDLDELFAEARADRQADQVARARRRWTPAWLAAAAAAGLLVGIGGTALVAHRGSTGPVGRTVALSAFGVGTSGATMQVHSTGSAAVMTIDASSLPTRPGDRYEVWLTNAARTVMQPIGWLSNDNTARISVPTNLSAHYTNVEVSVQSVSAASYGYSGTSVLRGTY